jgi:prepilin-type N-terminal cleavage/methylation domain-containing protein
MANRNGTARAFTFIEMLMVIAIIGLLVALLLPVMRSARRSGQKSACIQQMRQIGAALSLYTDSFGKYPREIASLRGNGLADTQLLCPVDPVGGFGTRFQACFIRKASSAHKTSYETVFGWTDDMMDKLAQRDANFGVVACRLHGDHTESFLRGLTDFCRFGPFMFSGPLLRLRRDGSVEMATLTLPAMESVPGSKHAFSIFDLFVDR